MDSISCLYLEHDDKAYERLSVAISSWWKNVTHADIVFDRASSVEKAIEMMTRPGAGYHLFLSDVLFPPIQDPDAAKETHVQRGLQAVSVARRQTKALVVALSVGDLNRFPSLPTQALDGGAHIFRYIGQIFSEDTSGPENFVREIYELLVKKEIVRDPLPVEYDAADPKIAFIVSEIGPSLLKRAYKHIVRSDLSNSHLIASYITLGMSGAYVVRVENRSQNLLTATHLLKFSRTRKRLADEIERYPRNGPYSSNILLNYLGSDESCIVEEDGWYAIGALFERDTSTLADWLSVKQKRRDIEGVLSLLLREGGLKNGYKKDLSAASPQGRAIDALMPNLSRHSRIVQALDDLLDVIADSSLGGNSDWKNEEKRIRRFLASKRIGERSAGETPDTCYVCECHGDLHTRNVLVRIAHQKQGAPILIDWSDHGVHHWAVDYARLLADLLLSVFDRGVLSHKWDRLPAWREVAGHLLNRTHLPDESGDQNTSVRSAMRWMVENLGAICPAVEQADALKQRRWELQLALAIEFMRGSYRTDLTTPKRALGLLVATDALIVAERSLADCGIGRSL